MKRLLLLVILLLATQPGCRHLRENLFEGASAAKAVATCREKIGKNIQALKLEITKDTATLRIRQPDNPDNVDEYLYAHGICKGPQPVQLNNVERAMSTDSWIFSLDEIDLEATPTASKDALARAAIEEGRVTKITIQRDVATGVNESRELAVRWTINIQGTRESASATADARGKIIGVDLSGTSRAAKQHYLDPQTLRTAIREIKKGFAGRVTLLELDISDYYLWFKAVAPGSDEVNQYQYDLKGVVNKGAASVMPLPKGKRIEDRYFQIDDVDFGATEQVLQTAAVKANAKRPFIRSMNISVREPDVFSNKLQIFWDVLVADGSPDKLVTVNFDAHGRHLPR